MPDETLQVKLEVVGNSTSSVVALPDGQAFWRLPVEHVHSDINRQPVVFALPMINAGAKGGAPRAFAIDFGMLSEQITLKGISKDNEDDTERPSYPMLQAMARNSWRFVSMSGAIGTMKGGIRLTMNNGQGQGTKEYRGVVLGLRGDREGGQLRWEWSLILQVTEWPNNGEMAPGSI